MAFANERVAAMSNLNGEQYKEAMRQQEVWANIGTDLRKERLELQERMAEQQMDKIGQTVEQMNAADRQQAEFRADMRGSHPDAQAEQAYFEEMARAGQMPTDEGRKAWVQEWRDLSEDHRQAGVDAVAQAGVNGAWRTVEKDEVLQPGARVRMDMDKGTSEVWDQQQGNDRPPPSGVGSVPSGMSNRPRASGSRQIIKIAKQRRRRRLWKPAWGELSSSRGR